MKKIALQVEGNYLKRAVIINNALGHTWQIIVQIYMWITTQFASVELIIWILKEDAFKVSLSLKMFFVYRNLNCYMFLFIVLKNLYLKCYLLACYFCFFVFWKGFLYFLFLIILIQFFNTIPFSLCSSIVAVNVYYVLLQLAKS